MKGKFVQICTNTLLKFDASLMWPSRSRPRSGTVLELIRIDTELRLKRERTGTPLSASQPSAHPFNGISSYPLHAVIQRNVNVNVLFLTSKPEFSQMQQIAFVNALGANTVTAGLSQRQERLSTWKALARLSCPGPQIDHASGLPSGSG